MQDRVSAAWSRILACLGPHATTLRLRPGASEAALAEAEAAIGVTLPADLRAWYRLHDGEAHAPGRVEWLPAGGRLLPLAVVAERWRDEQEWASADDPGLLHTQDDGRICSVVRHALRIVIAGNQWGDGDNTYLDLVPGPSGTPGQVIVATSECDFEVVGTSFVDFLERWAAAFEAGELRVVNGREGPRVDLAQKPEAWSRWEGALRAVRPL